MQEIAFQSIRNLKLFRSGMPPQPPGGVNPSLKNPGFFKGGDLRGFLAAVHAWESPTETSLRKFT